ncbi:MAG: transglycosylase domain-containing protein, partial [Deltaproteobacteria bacterium]|nr:transglycosylase domain-containing protein [Deltaproteobacteria bacterium]
MTRGRKSLLSAAAAAILCLAAVWMIVPDPTEDALHWPVSPVLLDQRGVLIHARLSADGEWCLPIPLSEMGEWLPKVLVAVEDRRFHSHSGVDFLALGRALYQNLRQGRVVSGASTITSQLVRLSRPRQRTFQSKILEFVGAWKLERSLDKERILELYLNRAPFGGPIRGAEAAARLYFGKRAKELSLGEAALLVGLLKGPTLYRPDKNPLGAQKRRRQIIARVAEQTGFPADLTALALQEPLPAFKAAMPDKVRHFADLVFRTMPRQGGQVLSSLDSDIQDLLRRALLEQLEPLGRETTAAGIVAENATGRILA